MHKEQTVSEMVEEVLTRQAKTLVERSGYSFEAAMEAVSKTDAGRQLIDLAEGPHRYQRAQDWQVSLVRERQEQRHSSWWSADCVERIEDCVEELEGKEFCAGYYTRLEELASLRA